MPQTAPREEYSRAEVRRRFGLTERQLKSWENRGLIPPAETYTFSGLIAIQTILKLRESHIRPRQIEEALQSVREKLGMSGAALSEFRIVSDGGKVAVQLAGQRMEALTGQILLDFDAAALGSLREFPEPKRAQNAAREAEAWFQKGLELEETGATAAEAVAAYQRALELNPTASGALVNLGTIYYRLKKYKEAEKYYTEAILADPAYPLAEFNLGNLYDEQGRTEEAVTHYRRALQLNPSYADAHFNLALLCERSGEHLKAVHHWRTYLKLDNSGEWADIARRQLDKLRQATVIQPR